MDLLDRLLGHDAWTTRHLLMRCREIGDEGLTRSFDVGHGTVHGTLVHIVGVLETWTDLLHERPIRRTPQASPAIAALGDLVARFDAVYAEFAALARRVRDAGRWDETFLDVRHNPPMAKSFGGAIGHVITHNMAHRAELLHMLERLGLLDLIEGDALSWENRYRHAAG